MEISSSSSIATLTIVCDWFGSGSPGVTTINSPFGLAATTELCTESVIGKFVIIAFWDWRLIPHTETASRDAVLAKNLKNEKIL